eukprot:tig00020603_g11831.t1
MTAAAPLCAPPQALDGACTNHACKNEGFYVDTVKGVVKCVKTCETPGTTRVIATGICEVAACRPGDAIAAGTACDSDATCASTDGLYVST